MSSFNSDVQRMGRHWLVRGLMYGYPPCCIAAFVRGEQLLHDYVIPAEYHNTGFVPCRDCAKVKPSIVLEHIARHRSQKLEDFPSHKERAPMQISPEYHGA